jgi:hypothetical protein
MDILSSKHRNGDKGEEITDGGIVYELILTNAKFQIGKRGQTTQVTERSSRRRQRCAMDCTATEEERGEVTFVNQMGKRTISYTSMSEEALIYVINFKVGSELTSNCIPLSEITETQTK